MKYGRFVAATALVVASIGVGSTVTLGSTAPPGDGVGSVRDAETGRKSPGAAEPGAFDASAELNAGFIYLPITPYRTYDSRENFPGRITTDEEQVFTVLTDRFDVPQIPATATAVTYNITVTETQGGGGFLAIYPADVFWPGNASINWTLPGTTVGNGGTTAIGFWTADGEIAVLMGAGDPLASTDYIIDITGYYIPLGA